MKRLRPLWRFIYFSVYTSLIVIEIWIFNVLRGPDIRRSMRIRRKWARNLLRGIGVNLSVTGEIPDFPCLLVCNHRSYLDPILMLCDVDAFPVAKAELAKWPVIGKGAQMAGILYLRRDHAGSRAGTLRKIHEVILSGIPVIIFPEGTTSALEGTLPFKKGIFLLAARSEIPVVPVALRFEQPEDYWVGKESFLRHAGRRFREKRINVSLSYGRAIQCGEPEQLLDATRNWIENKLISQENNAPKLPE